jgi:hypothetical protein
MSTKELDRWRRQLWKMARRGAKKHSGPAVVDALRRATKSLNEIGMDNLYDKLAKADPKIGLYHAFDITWLAAFAVELERPPQSK